MTREDTKKPLQHVVRSFLACSLIWGGAATAAAAYAGPAGHVSAAARRPTAGRDARPARSHSAPSAPIVLLPPYAVYAAASRRPATRAHSARYGAPGLTLTSQDKGCAPPPAHHSSGHRSTTPPSVDLSRYDPPVADEGQVHAGAAWATAYTLLGWWAAKDGLTGAPFAPMSLYAQLAHGKNRPVALTDVLALEQRQGVDTQADYRQGNADYRRAPTRAERANAAFYRIAGYRCVYRQRHSPVSARTAIEESLAGGQPLALVLPVDERFIAASAAEPLVDLSGRKSASLGGEAVVAVAYDGNGVWVENQWGSGWGLYGYAELSWRFVNASVAEAWTISVRSPAKSAAAPAAGTPAAGATAVTSYTSALPISATPTAYTSYTPYASCPTATSVGGYPDYAASPTPYGVPTPTTTPAPADTIGVTPTATSVTTCAPYGAAYAYPTSVATYPTYPTDTSAYATPYAYPTTDTSAYVYATPYAYPTYPTDTATDTATPSSPTPTTTATGTPTSPTPTPGAKPQVADLPTSGPPGTTIYVAGTGFGPGAVLVFWNNSPAGLAFTDGEKFSLGITAPAGATPGAATITCVNAATNASASTTFTVVAAQTAPAGPTVTPIPTPTAPSPSPTPSATATTPTATSTP